MIRPLLLVAVIASAPAQALTFTDVDFVCPIDGESFKQRVASSGTQIGQMLDLKPQGPIAAPWPLPVCPTSGFIMYRRDFSVAEVERLKAYVASEDYASVRNAESTYYLVARLRTFLGESREAIAFSLLQATWQARTPEQYARYAKEALTVYQQLLGEPSREEKKMPTYELVTGELERRLGLFDQAHGRFERLKNMQEFKQGLYPDIIELQLRLVEEKNAKPYQIPRKRP